MRQRWRRRARTRCASRCIEAPWVAGDTTRNTSRQHANICWHEVFRFSHRHSAAELHPEVDTEHLRTNDGLVVTAYRESRAVGAFGRVHEAAIVSDRGLGILVED